MLTGKTTEGNVSDQVIAPERSNRYRYRYALEIYSEKCPAKGSLDAEIQNGTFKH